MFNNRDSYTDFTPNKQHSIAIPYAIGTIVESKENSEILAKICQYRIIVKDYKQVINVGLNFNIYNPENKIEREITVEELEKNWKESNKLFDGYINRGNVISIGLPNPEPLFDVPREEIKESVKTLKF